MTYRIPTAMPDAIPRLIARMAAVADDDRARFKLRQEIAHALSNGLGDHMERIGAVNLRIGSAWQGDTRIVHIARTREVGVQVVLCHAWDEPDVAAILGNGHVLIVMDPAGGIVHRRCGSTDETMSIAGGIPIHDFGIGCVSYAACIATHLRSLRHDT